MVLAGFTILLFVIAAFKFINKILQNLEKKIKQDILENKLKYGYISRKDLAGITPEVQLRNVFLYRLVAKNSVLLGILPYRLIFKSSMEEEFNNYIRWCERYIESLNCSDRRYVSSEPFVSECDIKGLQDMTCLREILYSYSCAETGIDTYVLCVLVKQSKDIRNDDIWPEIGEGAVQTFVGKMAADGIKCGIIITTGNFSAQAEKYARTISSPYSLELLDGTEIAKRHRAVARVELEKLKDAPGIMQA
jgi:hypothetical protein